MRRRMRRILAQFRSPVASRCSGLLRSNLAAGETSEWAVDLVHVVYVFH
jgi:hypothetical protein